MKIAVTNLKGGVGKTTLSVNLAVSFAHMKYKVALIDTDTNQNSLSWNTYREETLPNISVWGHTIPETIFAQVKELHKNNDIVIMDGTPNLNKMSKKIMQAADLLIIPIRPSAYDYRSLNEFYDLFQEVRSDKENFAAYFVLNEYDDRQIVHKTVREQLKETYGEIEQLTTSLKSRSSYGISAINGTGVIEGTDQKAKMEIDSLAKEILTKAQQHNFIAIPQKIKK